MMTQKSFVEAKTESIRSSKQSEEDLAKMYSDVVDAMRIYSGSGE